MSTPENPQSPAPGGVPGLGGTPTPGGIPGTAPAPVPAAPPAQPPPLQGTPSTGVASGSASGPRAGFWRRFGAALIDGIILGIVFGILVAAAKGVGYGIAILIQIAYFTYFEGGPRGQTPGKSALGIRVIDFNTGGPLGYGRGFIRWIGRILSSAVIYLGYLWMLWDREKQTWHDKLATAVVVPVDAYPLPPRGT